MKGQMRFADYIILWKTDCRSELRAGWRLSQDQMIRDYLVSLNSKKLNAIKPIDILRVLTAMKELGRSDQTRLHVYNLMASIFKSAVNLYGLIDESPVSISFKPKVKIAEPLFLVPEHGFMLLAHSIGDTFELAIFINLLCGLRVGEIQGLTWEGSFDFDKKELKIYQHWCRKTKKLEPKTKNGKELRVPIPELLLTRLLAHRKKSGFITAVKGKIMVHCSFHKAIKRMCKQLNIPQVSSHGLRHSCGEIWYEKGATLEDLRRLLNHSSEKSTHRYIHRSDRRIKEIASTITAIKKRAI